MALQNKYIPSVVFHPGDTLAEKLEEMGMGPKEFALRTGKPEKTIIAILNGQSNITADMAVQFENVTKIPAHFWMNHQRSYDEFNAREKRKVVIEEAAPWAKEFPISEMIKKGWLTVGKTIQEKTESLMAFFGIAHHGAWEDYYYNQELKVAFRISLHNTSNPFSISAWLRKGELQAAEIQSSAYDEKAFKNALETIKKLMASQPEGYFYQLQNICRETGVKVVYTPCIAKAPINGATRWLGDTPLIQMTGRYKRNDIFWFTFFHEAGHILLHGKKDIFLEKVEYTAKDLEKEAEADAFAIKWTFSEEQEEEYLRDAIIDAEQDIRGYAKKFNTHPSIIAGRLFRNKQISPARAFKYFSPVNLDDDEDS